MTHDMRRLYIVLADQKEDEEEFLPTIQRLVTWSFTDSKPEMTLRVASHPADWQDVYDFESDDHTSRLIATEDRSIGVRYVMLEGSVHYIESVSRVIQNAFEIVTLRELQRMAEEQLAHEPELLVKVAIASGDEPDPTTIRLLEGALHNVDRTIRMKGVEAAALTQWPQFAPPLAKIYSADEDPEVRWLAGESLRLLVAVKPRPR